MTDENSRKPSKFGDTGYEGYKVSVKLVREGVEEYDPVYISNSRDVYEFIQDIEDNDRESFYSIHLDNKNKIISCEEVSRGGAASATVHPREVFKAALLTSAQGLVLVHNHPSGDSTPSPEDLAVSRRLYDCGELLGINVLDSVIVGNGSYYSFGDRKQLKTEN
jgi:DNA repair protein RadC